MSNKTYLEETLENMRNERKTDDLKIYVVGYEDDGEFKVMGETRLFFTEQSAKRSLTGKKSTYSKMHPYKEFVDELFVGEFTLNRKL